MKKIFRLLCFVFLIFLMFPLTSCEEVIDPLDYILNYDIEVNPREDGTLDMTYRINWKVLDDSREGPLEWVKIGVANRFVDEIRPLTDNIQSAYYESDDGAFVHVDFKKAYYRNETVDFSFALHQSRFYTLKDDRCNFQFITGWFDKIQVEKATVKWRKDNVVYANTDNVVEDYLYYEYFLDYGNSIEVDVSYYQTSFVGLDKSKGYSHQYLSSTDRVMIIAIIGFLALFFATFIISYIKADHSKSQYENYRGFVAPNSFVYHNHYYLYHHNYVSFDSKGNRIVNSNSSSSYHGGCCGGGCACACACACAGGGRAGCTRKDFYKQPINLEKAKKALDNSD